MFKPYLGAVAAAALAVALTGCGGSEPKVADAGSAAAPAEEQKQEEKSTENLAVGTVVDLGDGLTLSVDSVETVADYSGSNLIKATVTYKNGGDKTASYNFYDWKGEDANGAQESPTTYVGANATTDDNALQSGDLAAGGTKTGTLYFKDGTTKILYSGLSLTKEIKASWNVA